MQVGRCKCYALRKDESIEDIIVIDIPSRSINVKLSDEELEARPQQPLKRNRVVSKALRAYAQSVASADKGGVRLID